MRRTVVTYASLGRDDREALRDNLSALIAQGKSPEEAATQVAATTVNNLVAEGFAPGDQNDWAAHLITVADAIVMILAERDPK